MIRQCVHKWWTILTLHADFVRIELCQIQILSWHQRVPIQGLLNYFPSGHHYQATRGSCSKCPVLGMMGVDNMA